MVLTIGIEPPQAKVDDSLLIKSPSSFMKAPCTFLYSSLPSCAAMLSWLTSNRAFPEILLVCLGEEIERRVESTQLQRGTRYISGQNTVSRAGAC